MKAIWNDRTVAQSNDTKVVEGNHYFPPGSVNKKYLEESETETYCAWKGKAKYYHLVDEDRRSEDVAWYYPEPSDEASHIKDHIAFYDDVKIEED